jgi:exosortase A-associated hydrolase 1/exosortase A-associated hydrolase 2
MTTPLSAPKAFMLDGARGALCAFYFEPQAGQPLRGDLLVVPAFAEEMNRCRAMVALQARRLAAQGVGTLVLDPYGTGDSAGEFADATWAQWRDDLLRGVAWLDAHGQGCRALLGVRLGAVMAGEIARACAGVQQLVLWQPVLSGKTFQTQFLRIRIAAEMDLPERVKSTAELRAMSAAGQVVEVSGYEVGSALAADLDAVAFEAAAWPARVATQWFEVASDDSMGLAPASQSAIDAQRAAGAVVDAQVVTGPPFWHVHERELAPALIEATLHGVAAWPEAWPARLPATAFVDAHAPVQPLVLPCGDERLSACLHRGAADATRGVVIVVAGGPQYRAGAHRQFVSHARTLAGQGWPVLRFDLRGMGDSSGSYLGYQHSAPDIRAAIDALAAQHPALRDVVLMGECESASGILFYAWQDERVAGAVLINPWVFTAEGRAQVIVKDYYWDRLRSRAFWLKVRSGEFSIATSAKSLVEVLRAYFRGRRIFARSSLATAPDDFAHLPLPVKTAVGLSRYKGRALLLMSGKDQIAREFDEVTKASAAWRGLLDTPSLLRRNIEGADHTFSRRAWKTQAADAIVQWMHSW